MALAGPEGRPLLRYSADLMSGYLPDGKHGELTIFFTGAGVPTGAAVVYGVRNNTVDWSAAHAQTLLNNWVAAFNGVVSGSVAATRARLKAGPNLTGPIFDVTSAGVMGGAAMGAAAVSVGITKNTALGGRRGRGKTFVPGVPEADVDPGGTLAAARLTAWQTAATGFFATFATNNWDMVLLHSPASLAITPTTVTSTTVSSVVRTQRRRQRRS